MKYILHLILFCCLLSSTGSFAQSTPYTRETGRELSLVGSGLALNGISFYLNTKNEILHPDEIELLDANDIIGIDRWVTRMNAPGAKRSSDIALFSSYVLPFTLLLDEPSREDFSTVGLMTVEGLLLNAGITNIVKNTVKRPRPYLYNSAFPIEAKLRKSARYSYFSGHASNTAVLSFMTAKMYSDYYPDSDMKPLVWGLAAAIPAFTGMQRVRAGKHFLTDVLTGYAVGMAIGLLIPELHK